MTGTQYYQSFSKQQSNTHTTIASQLTDYVTKFNISYTQLIANIFISHIIAVFQLYNFGK